MQELPSLGSSHQYRYLCEECEDARQDTSVPHDGGDPGRVGGVEEWACQTARRGARVLGIVVPKHQFSEDSLFRGQG